MNKITDFLGKIASFFNTRTKKLGLATLISVVLLRCPAIVQFLPKEVVSALMSAASDIVTAALAVLPFVVKDKLQTGGTIATTPEAEARIKDLSDRVDAAEKKLQDVAVSSVTNAAVVKVVEAVEKKAA